MTVRVWTLPVHLVLYLCDADRDSTAQREKSTTKFRYLQCFRVRIHTFWGSYPQIVNNSSSSRLLGIAVENNKNTKI